MIKLDFKTPEHGWLEVHLRHHEKEHYLVAADLPGDSLGELASVLLKLCNGSQMEAMEWSLEPAFERWIFECDAETLYIHIFIEDQQINTYSAPKSEVILGFYRGLRKLESDSAWKRDDVLEHAWDWPFPSDALNRLKKKIKA